ncbi:glucokinase [Bacillaceae bacterium]
MAGRQEFFVGIDLGGTAIKLAFVDAAGRIGAKTEAPTPVREGGDAIILKMKEMIDDLAAEHGVARPQLKGIGIGAPAFMDIARGYVYEAINLGWKNYPLKEKLESLTRLPVYVDNDANTAALGEMWQGAGRGAKHLICITLGTGIGGGIIVDGDIYRGANGMAGEAGHMTLLTEGGPPCNCGKTGCLEVLSSATAIGREGTKAVQEGEETSLRETWEREGRITARHVVEAAKRGDRVARDILAQAGFYLGLGLSHLANAFNPQKIVIGGGVSRAGDVLMTPVLEAFRRFALARVREACEVLPASLGNDAGVIGAAWLAKTER